MWLKKNIPEHIKLQIYDAIVVSVIMYNSSSWAAPQAVFDKLDRCHRKQLRTILNIHWPSKISNINLYKRCNCTSLSARAKKSRFSMLGHILRMPENSPAMLSLAYTVNVFENETIAGRAGRHQFSLIKLLKDDIRQLNIFIDNVNINLNSSQNVAILRELASDRPCWNSIFN